jgi:ComF family protein
VLDALLELVFPPRCVGCGKRGFSLCQQCRAELPMLEAGICARCSSLRPANGTCRGCRQLSPQLMSIRAVCSYRGAARKAVHIFKFRSGRYLAPVLGELLRAELKRRPIRADLLIPVPIAPGRLRDRGYNQTELLAHQIVGIVGARFAPDLLQRKDRTPQLTLSAADRMTNLEGAFTCVAPERVKEKRILLVDDVCTTGATLSACAEALVEAGAARVSAIVFARDL